MNKTYVTTSVAYVNWAPHLWFAMESIIADIIARSQKMLWKDVYFWTWTDEHWIKIVKTAQEKWMSIIELCDKNALEFKRLKESLNLSWDNFIRTSDQEKHWPWVIKIWGLLEKKWDIYKKHYEWEYCEWCESFIPQKELIEWKCEIHKKKPTPISEENYFFRLSKYSDAILKLLKSWEIKIVPDFRKNEILKMLEWEWLKDVSFSRPSNSLPWWVPVPWDDTQNMYVWCDALTNYISALWYWRNEKLFKKYWESEDSEIVHCIWKDIVRFHAWIWIWMLLSAELRLPKIIHIHWFLTSEWEKMSKSTWNVVDPFEYTEEFWEDALRYYLTREIPTWRDSDFSRDHFKKIYNAHLANWLWNLVNRVSVMSKKNWVKPVQDLTLENFKEIIKKVKNNFTEKSKEYDTNLALIEAWKLVDFWNKQMDEIKPWVLKKEDEKKFEEVMQNFLILIKETWELLYPFMPKTSEKILEILGFSENWTELWEPEILFQRLED